MLDARIKSLCEKRGVTLAAACRESGVAYGTLHAQLKNGREIPFSTIDRLGRYFDVPVSYFSEFRTSMSIMSEEGKSILHQRAAAAYTAALQSAQVDLMRSGLEIGTEQILDWLAAEGGRLTNFDAIRDRVDLFHPIEATDSLMRPLHIGQQSLVTRQLGLENEVHYTEVVGRFDRGLIDRVMSAHARAQELPYMVSDEAIEIVFGNRRVKHSYRRVLARVQDSSGKVYTLVHAKPI